MTRSGKTSHKYRSDRDISLDLLRVIAIILMIITHVNGLFYRGSNDLLDYFTWLGATVCFTLFLFAYGFGYGRKFTVKNKKDFKTITLQSFLRRWLNMLFWYYVVAGIVYLVLGKDFKTKHIIDIVLLQRIPDFTEFILAFILYDFILWILQKWFWYLLKKPKYLMILALTMYFFSIAGYGIEFDSKILLWAKGLLVGHADLHRFGILTYFLVLVAGMFWGKASMQKYRIVIKDIEFNKIELSFILFIIFLFCSYALKLTGFSIWNRWPASLHFILYGLYFCFLVIFMGEILAKRLLFTNKKVLEILVTISKNTFKFYRYHVIILMLLICLLNNSVYDKTATMGLFVLVICFSWMLVTIDDYLCKKLLKI